MLINRVIYFLKRLRQRYNFISKFNKQGYLDPKSKLAINGQFVYGRNITINGEGIDNSIRSQIVILPGAKLEIGDDTGMSQVSITCKQFIHIGSHVTIGAGTLIFDTNFHNTDWKVRRNHAEDLRTAKNASVFIGDDVFIGTRCIICKGVSIGDRTIIAAGSVVVKDIPSDCIAGGNPCKIIRHNPKDE